MSLIYMLGMAGSEKTTLTKNLYEWLTYRGEQVSLINLDPRVLRLSFEPDFDIREIVDVKTLMENEGLGPNGGLLKANEIILENIHVVISKMKAITTEASYAIIDTPGQLELFAFRELGSSIISQLSSHDSVGIFILDALNLQKPSDIVMAILLALAVRFHLDIEVVMVINKIDLTKGNILEDIRQFFFDPREFEAKIRNIGTGVISELSSQLAHILKEFLPPSRIVGISALKKRNFDGLISLIYDVFCGCGDLT